MLSLTKFQIYLNGLRCYWSKCLNCSLLMLFPVSLNVFLSTYNSLTVMHEATKSALVHSSVYQIYVKDSQVVAVQCLVCMLPADYRCPHENYEHLLKGNVATVQRTYSVFYQHQGHISIFMTKYGKSIISIISICHSSFYPTTVRLIMSDVSCSWEGFGKEVEWCEEEITPVSHHLEMHKVAHVVYSGSILYKCI